MKTTQASQRWRYCFTFLLILFLLQDAYSQQIEKVDKIISVMNQSNSNYVMVIAHRGDWRNSPENSIRAIERVIDMGVDMVEIDIQRTKDGILILMHDNTLDRTTTGKGKIKDFTLEEIRQLYLRNGTGNKTTLKVPTLEEALMACKGKILVNIDKGYQHFEEAYEIIKKTGTERQVLIKGSVPYHELVDKHADLLKKTIYMPVIFLNKPEAGKQVNTFAEKMRPAAFELVFDKDTSALLSKFYDIRKQGSRVWVNTLWASLCAAHEDDRAIEYNDMDESWGWVISKGANMIQTDRPKELIEYLKSKKLRKGL